MGIRRLKCIRDLIKEARMVSRHAVAGNELPITVEQFAKFSFEHEKSQGQYPAEMKFEELPQCTKDEYVNEAAFFADNISVPKWPDYILQKIPQTQHAVGA